MISIIICSRTHTLSESLQKNIEDSIGVPYQLVLIDNSKNQFDIFTAYNKGVALSNFPIICFMHDDIHFHTMQWGKKVVEKFNNEKTGAIGVAGTPYYPVLAGPWWSGGVVSKFLLQNDLNEPEYLAYETPVNNQLAAVVLDGVWICIRKSLFEKIQFDTKSLQGYHFYDIDICLQIINLGFEIQSVYDILIHHQSNGVMNQNWMKNCLIVQEKWSNNLPVHVKSIRYSQCIKIEYRALQEYLEVQKINGISFFNRCKFAINQLIRYRLPLFTLRFPLVLTYLIIRDLFKKIGLRS